MEENIYVALLHKLWITQKKLFFIFVESANTLSFREFYEQLSTEYLWSYNFSTDQISIIMENYKKYNIEFLKNKLKERNVNMITYLDWDYPKEFKSIPNPPFILYLRGKIWSRPKISIVGSRKITDYGKKVIEKITPTIWKYFDIVSWWAAWCDTKAHQVALENKVPTLSIIGTGIDQDYPVWNKTMFDKIVELWWGVLSIFPVWEPWNPYNFPVRNELVAWLSLWVLVVEAQKKSGTLITAQIALDIGKDVFAIPWEIWKIQSEWCNSLIQLWSAKLVVSAEDILWEYNISVAKDRNRVVTQIRFADPIEESIYNLLLVDNFTADELTRELKLSIQVITLKLSMLEIQWHINRWLSWKYQIL